MPIIPLPAHGTLNWDIPLNSILRQLGNQWVPDDYGWLSWTFDPSQVGASTVVAANGDLHTIGVWLRQAATVSNIILEVGNPGVTLTAGQNFAGLYDSAGTRVGITADQSTAWQSNGTKVMPLTAPASLAAGKYYIAFVVNGATRPGFDRETSFGPLNGSLTAANFRSGLTAGPNTTLPTTLALGSRAASTLSWWGAIS